MNKLAIITPTKRPEFWPFLRKQLDKQRFNRPALGLGDYCFDHIVIYDEEISKPLWTTHVISHPAHRVGLMRNAGLAYAREHKYEFVIFCDDDDWLHPYAFQRLLERAVLLDAPPIVGWGGGTIVDLWTLTYQSLSVSPVSRRVIPCGGSTIYRLADLPLTPHGVEAIGSDATWIDRLLNEDCICSEILRPMLHHALFLRHGKNTSNTSYGTWKPNLELYLTQQFSNDCGTTRIAKLKSASVIDELMQLREALGQN